MHREDLLPETASSYKKEAGKHGGWERELMWERFEEKVQEHEGFEWGEKEVNDRWDRKKERGQLHTANKPSAMCNTLPLIVKEEVAYNDSSIGQLAY